MGFGQSKEQQNNIAVSQTVTNNELANQVNLNGIFLITIMVLLVIVVLHIVRNQCKNSLRGFFQNPQSQWVYSGPPAGQNLSMVKVEPVQPPTQAAKPSVVFS